MPELKQLFNVREAIASRTSSTILVILLSMVFSIEFGIVATGMMVVAICIAMIIYLKPISGIGLLYLTTYFLPTMMNQLDIPYNQDRVIWAIMVLLVLVFLVKISKNGLHSGPIEKMMFAFAFILIFSAFLTENPIVVTLKTTVTYFQYLFFYLFVKNIISLRKSVSNVLFMVLVAVYSQIPFVIIQRLLATDKFTSSDNFVGLLGKGATGHLAILMVIGYSILLSRILHGGKIKSYVIQIIIITLPIMIGSGKFGILLLVIVSLILAIITNTVTSFRIQAKNIMLITLVSSFIVFFISNVLPTVTVRENSTLKILTSPTKMMEYAFYVDDQTGYATGKLARVLFTFNHIKGNTKSILLGYGPGTLSKSDTFNEQGQISQAMMSKIGFSTGLSVLLAELGFMGLIGYVSLLIGVFLHHVKVYKHQTDLHMRIMSSSFIGILVCYSLSLVYIRPFFDPISSLIMWGMAGVIDNRNLASSNATHE
jgi:hypothetical protein